MPSTPYADYAVTSDAPDHHMPSHASHTVDWALRGLLAFAFIGAGATKIIGIEQSVSVFEAIDACFGIGMWFMWLTAILEIGGGLAILVPRLARPAALMLATVSLGALVTNLFVVPSPPYAAAMLLALCLAVLWLHRSRTV